MARLQAFAELRSNVTSFHSGVGKQCLFSCLLVQGSRKQGQQGAAFVPQDLQQVLLQAVSGIARHFDGVHIILVCGIGRWTGPIGSRRD
jgi:hypothetical protein